MSAPWRRRRRSTYSSRLHDIATRPQADTTTWWKTPDGVAHAFTDGSTGVLRSRCRAIRWSTSVVTPLAEDPRCSECVLLTEGAPGEITEAWGK